MNILLAVDGSTYTKRMLAYLATHSELFATGNDYTVLTVQPQLPPRARAAVGKTAPRQNPRTGPARVRSRCRPPPVINQLPDSSRGDRSASVFAPMALGGHRRSRLPAHAVKLNSHSGKALAAHQVTGRVRA